MHDKVNKGEKIIDIMIYTYIGFSVITVLAYFILYGLAEGISRLITLGIGTVITVALLKAVKKGSLAARVTLIILSLAASLLDFYAVHVMQLIQFNASLFGKLINNIMMLYFLLFGSILLLSPQINSIRKYYKLVDDLQWIWNWNGTCIGYKDKGFLWNGDGKIIGKFKDNEIFSQNGSYIGELYKGNNRACVDKTKSEKKIDPFEKLESNYEMHNNQRMSTMPIYTHLIDFKVNDYINI
ncbi:MAG: hypothetical protein Q8942_13290 [Bacillota bacterium]|nr:hypothetical protein [Bacillota bacterium]